MLAFVAFVVGVLVVGGLLFLGASLLLGRGETRPAAELERQVRAYTPWPGTFVETGDGRLLVRRAAVGAAGPEQSDERPGLLEPDGDGLALTTGAGRLRLLEVQPAGGGVSSKHRREAIE